VIDRESTMCSCTEICKHQQKIDKHTHCAADNYNCLHACDPDFKFEPDIEHATNDPVSEILPNLPAMLNLEDLKAYIDSEIQKAVKPLEEENQRLRESIENLESQICTIKGHLNLDDFFYDSLLAKGVTPLYDQITELKERTVLAHEKPIEEKNPEPEIIPRTTLELKAVSLVERLRIKPRSRTGEVFLDNTELTNFLTKELPEELRSEDSNLRRVKKRVIEKAKSLFPNAISINKSKYGRHETRIIFKESYQSNRNGTLV